MNAPSVDITQYREQYSMYAKKLLSDLGLGDIGQPERGQLLAAFEGLAQQVILTTVLENMTDEAMDRGEELINKGYDQQEVATRVMVNIPDIDLKIADALALTYAQMMNDAKQLTEAIASKRAADGQAE